MNTKKQKFMEQVVNDLLIEKDAQRVRKEMEENLPVLFVLTWTTVQKHTDELEDWQKFESRSYSFVFDKLSKVTNAFQEYRQSIIDAGLQTIKDAFHGSHDDFYVCFSAESDIERHTLEIQITKINKTLVN